MPEETSPTIEQLQAAIAERDAAISALTAERDAAAAKSAAGIDAYLTLTKATHPAVADLITGATVEEITTAAARAAAAEKTIREAAAAEAAAAAPAPPPPANSGPGSGPIDTSGLSPVAKIAAGLAEKRA